MLASGAGIIAHDPSSLQAWAEQDNIVIEEVPDPHHPRQRILRVRKASSDEAPRYVPLHDRDADPSVGEHLPD